MTTKLLKKIEALHPEMKPALQKKKKPISLWGYFKGLKITERDIEQAKKELFRNL